MFDQFKNTAVKIKSNLIFDTYGNIATASFVIAAITGIFLAVPYDVAKPYESISKLILFNPAASFIRSLHYWSAQFFLVFTFLHIWEHFKKNTEKKIKKGIWLRLTFSIFFVFYVMLSGFILKGDADSTQAFRIISNLFSQIPLIGNLFADTLLGKEGDWQIIYVHHIATATIFLAVIIFEHAKYIWTKIKTNLYLIIILSIVSILFIPYLHDGLNPVVKGPWYFVGLQEILHWISTPIIVIIILLIFFVLFYFIPKIKSETASIFKKFFFWLFWGYILITIFAYYFRGEDWNFVLPWENPYLTMNEGTGLEFNAVSIDSLKYGEISVVFGRAEGCLVCHGQMTGFTESHNPAALGCSSCHGGNPFSAEKQTAHSGMFNIPGNLNTASRTCGTADCHPDIIPRVKNSLMNTGSGLVSVDKFVFGEINLPEGHFNISELGHSAADTHLRQLCASCHIGNEKEEFSPINQESRGGGCNACHLNYSDEAAFQLSNYLADRNESNLPLIHPQTSINTSNDHCFGCHSRSGRISTNYEGWHETKLDSSKVINKDGYQILEDGRVFRFVMADIHYEKGMECVDCHISSEVMGDGNLYQHASEQTKVKCTDCHLTSNPKFKQIEEFDSESKKISDLRKLSFPGRKYLTVEKSGEPLINTYERNDSLFLVTKSTGIELLLLPPADVCTQGEAHKNLSCNSCHSDWSPQCIGCHTEYENDSEGFDQLEKKYVKGQWVEHIGIFEASPPVLGVKEIISSDSSQKEIDTFMPGMVISIDKSGFEKNASEIFRRLYSPSISHTIRKEARSCESCHNNPLAIGYGRGELQLRKIENDWKWQFTPKFAGNKHDGIPEDAWIEFLSEKEDLQSTRVNTRPFNLQEQKAILTVGACLTCHKGEEKIMKKAILNFDNTIQKMTDKCILPKF